MPTTKKDYEFVTLTDADKKAILEPELRAVETDLYRASFQPSYGDTTDLQARAEALKAEYETLTVE